VTYRVQGTLVNSTPSGFPAFDLQRQIDGTEFYAQGSSLSFTVSDIADLSDGLQVSELVADSGGVIFTFNGREIDNRRFHPSLFVLRENDTGTLQNSNNIHTDDPVNPITVDFGEEYITQLSFQDCITLVVGTNAAPECERSRSRSGGGFVAPADMVLFVSIFVVAWRRRMSR
jgi:hypothetical protein